MDFSLLHFAQADWLWGLLLIPTVLALYALIYRANNLSPRLELFADKHLLPHLVKNQQIGTRRLWLPVLVGALAWACGMGALAGPQWRYTDTQVFKPMNDLVIVLDLSSSMNAADVKPSRLVRAREEIRDIIDMNHGLTVGLVAYAAVPHMVIPLTDDMNSIRNLLPSLDTSLITIDGDQLKPALAMAAHMLGAEPGHDKSILVVSDGDYDERDSANLAQAAGDAAIYTMGVGTTTGAPIPSTDGGWTKQENGKIRIDPLHAEKLRALSAAGHGIYVEADYSDSDTRTLLAHIGNASDDAKVTSKTIRIWDEGFYVPALALALLLLPWFRRGRIFTVLILSMLLLPGHHAQAAELSEWFQNPAQQGKSAFDQGHYSIALQKFRDPYQQGVVAYRAGLYDKAAELFRAASYGKSGRDATYNLGNAQLMQGKPEDAISSYQSVLKQDPNYTGAEHNMEIARKMLQQRQQKQVELKNQDSKQQNNNKQSGQDAQNGQGADRKQPNRDQEKRAQQKQQTGQNSARPDDDKSRQQGQSQNQSQQVQQQQGKNAHQPQQDSQNSNQPLPQQAEQQLGQQSQNQFSGQSPQTESAATPQKPGENKQSAASDQAALRQVTDQPDHPTAESAGNHQRTRQDIDADLWLDHIQSDPGSFLRNQFIIEEQDHHTGLDGSSP